LFSFKYLPKKNILKKSESIPRTKMYKGLENRTKEDWGKEAMILSLRKRKPRGHVTMACEV
jgi:hypothetical protein